jgi:hypothetical protein
VLRGETPWGQIDELSEDEFPSSSRELGDLLTLAIGQTDPLPPSEGSVLSGNHVDCNVAIFSLGVCVAVPLFR